MRSWQVALGPVLIAGQRRWDRHGADAGRRWAWQAGVPCVRRGWPRRHGCGRFGCGWPCTARGPVRERPGYVTIRGLDGFRGNAPRDAGKQVKGHQARAQGACRPSRGGTSRLSTPLEGGRRQARHLLPRPKDRHLRERVLLASLPLCALPDPKSNVEFWNAKFARNRARDERDQAQLVAEGWTVLVVWECRLKKGRFEQTMRELVREIRRASGERERAAARGKKAPQGPGAPQPQSQPAPFPRPDLAWPDRGPCVIEIGSLPAWRHREVAKRLRLRHSMQSQVCSSKRSARAALGPVAPGSHARRRRG